MTEKGGPGGQIDLPPGFRFFPTDEELVVHYLCKKVVSHPLPAFIIGDVDLYKYDPWQLPEKALFGEKEWYFFTPRDRKYPNGSRPNRAAGSGYWKATGADKPITTCGGKKRVGVKKALVFYKGKAPKGSKTNWIMHEYRMAEINLAARKKNTLRLDDWVLCRIYNKKSSAEKLEEKKLAEEMESRQEMEMEEAVKQQQKQKNRQIVHLDPSHTDASTLSAEGGLPSTDSSTLVSQLPGAMNLSSGHQNPFYQHHSTDEVQLNMKLTNQLIQKQQHHSTDEVQVNMKLANQLIQKQQQQQPGQALNFSLGLDSVQNPFFHLDHSESSSLFSPYPEYIDSYSIQSSY